MPAVDLLLVRHGPAADRESWPGEDAARPLTEEGREKTAGVVRGLKALGVRLDLLLHSPWTRAVETAALMAPLRSGPVVLATELVVPPTRAVVEALLAQAEGQDTVALVGHEPHLSALLGALLLKRGAVPVVWKKGGVAWVQAEAPAPSAFTLHAFLPPSALRKLGRG